MKKFLYFFLFLLFLFNSSTQASTDFDLKGFKDVNFGMNTDDLRSLGAERSEFQFLTGPTRYTFNDNKEITLFSFPSNPVIYVEKGVVIKIDVSLDITHSELINLYKKAIGNPEVYLKIDKTHGMQFQTHLWVFKNKNSISMTRNLSDLNSAIRQNSTASYNDNERTKLLIEEAQAFSKKTRDF